MTMLQGFGQLIGTMAMIGGLCAAGAGFVCLFSWLVYRRDGGRAGLLRYMRDL